MKREKGQYGYRDKIRQIRLVITLVLVAAILAQLGGRWFTDNPAAKNILTVMAILTVLPMANMASPLLASWRYRTPPREFYEKVLPYEEKCKILYDLILTTKEFVLPMDAIAVHPHGVYAYCTEKNRKAKEAEKALNELFKASRLEPNIRILWDEKSFFKRLESLKPVNGDEDGTIEYEGNVLKSLSM
ncbi:MAG: O-linked GlcNAc transferase-like protein [Lachnospiraceae bacterium]|nr:O-linked GlcNAc transferase-like protein [Lachnospiraceae bacterium]